MHEIHHRSRIRRTRYIALVTLLGALFATIAGTPSTYADQQYTVTVASNQSQTAQVGTTFPENMVVRVCVVFSTPCQGVASVGVTFSAPASGASGTFATSGTNTVTVTTASNGIATAPAFTANSTTGSYSIRVVAAEPNPADAVPNFFFLTNSANPANLATQISTGNGSNQATLINTTFATQLSVVVLNGSNQLLSGITVTFTAPSSGASGTFSNTGTRTTTAVTGATGLATASPFTANGIDGSYTVTARVSGSQTASGNAISTTFALRNTLTNVIGVPDVVSASAGSGQQAPVLTPFATNMQVVVLDGSLNFVSGATVVFTAPASGPSGTFAGGSRTFTTTSGATGLASAPTFTANAIIGSYSVAVSATKNGVTANGVIGLINGRVQTTTIVTIVPTGSAVYGQPVVLTATVLPVSGTYVPGGPVAFKRGGAIISSCASVNAVGGVATCTLNGSDDQTTWLTPGSYSFSADYAGDAGSQPSIAPSVVYTVNKANTIVTIESSEPTGSFAGEAVTFTANVGSLLPGRGAPTGTVTFTASDGTPLNGGNPIPLVNGRAQVSTSSLQPGIATITATYSGNANLNGGNGTITQQVLALLGRIWLPLLIN
jgi:Fe-S cluster assembly iron-binding protein IscA